MANQERGELEVVINGTTYTLVLRTAALIALQKHFSTPDKVADMEEILRCMEARSFEHLVAGFWASLQKYHAGVTYEEAVNLLDDCNDWERISELFSALIAANRPDVKDVKELQSERPLKARTRRVNGTGESITSPPAASV
jgi:hypothetical protein